MPNSFVLVAMMCLFAATHAVPVMSGFDHDYEDKRAISELIESNQERSSLPQAPKNDVAHKHFALLMMKEPVPGAPPVEVEPDLESLMDDREKMKAGEDDPFDEDCDSPQIGEVEPYLLNGSDLDMNANIPVYSNENGTIVPEQSESEREVLRDSENFLPVRKDAIAWNATASVPVISTNETVASLPPPDPVTAKKNKCSKSINGHDVPEELDEMGEDCGMPEPPIPCETVGNSSSCDPLFVLKVPPLPPAEKMPPIPVPDLPVGVVDIAIEFPDFGISRKLQVHHRDEVGDVIIQAGKEFHLEAWHIQMIRNGGFQISPERRMFQLTDEISTVVYLRCVPREFISSLIVRLIACEDIYVKQLVARVEVPETDDVFEIDVLSTYSVQDVMKQSPIPLHSIDKITYNGARVETSQTLNEIRFANKSALIIYLTSAAAHQHAIASQQHHNNNNNNNTTIHDGPTDSTDGSSGSGSSVLPLAPIPSSMFDPIPRIPMTASAVITVHLLDSSFLDFPVLVRPDDNGLVIYEALHDRIGRPFSVFSITFQNVRIEQGTALKPIGLLDGDVVHVQMKP